MIKDLVESFSGVRFEAGMGEPLGDELEVLLRKYAGAYQLKLEGKNSDPVVVFGMDPRPSSKFVRNIILSALDCYVHDLGVATTPEVEEMVRHTGADGGVMISGSHSSEEYNGIKFMGPTGMLLAPDEMEELKQRKEAIGLSSSPKGGADIFCGIDSKNHYIDFLIGLIGGPSVVEMIRDYQQSTGLKIYQDPNGGSAVNVLELLSERTGIEFEKIHFEEGKPGREIEPNIDTLGYLKKFMGKNSVAFGYDYDADRVEAVLCPDSDFAKRREECVVSGQYVLGLMVNALLSNLKPEERKNQVVVANDATSYLVKEVVGGYGAKWVETEVGEVNVVIEMYKHGIRCKAGGEGSNGGYIVKPSTCRDGILAMLLTLRQMVQQGKGLDELLLELPEYYTLRNDNLVVDSQFAGAMKPALRAYFEERGFKDFQETGDNTGGLKILVDGSWIWYRGSKTKPKQFRLIVDSKEKAVAEELLREGSDALSVVYGRLSS